ncbi:MAG: MBL fold metallo-hydrolase [Mariniphaga sp.]
MQVCIHRGTNEIGGSCVEVVSNCGKRIILDLGLPLNAESNDKKYLPDISGLDGSDDSLLAVMISHPHLDHFGLLGHIAGNIPVIMGADARRILIKAAPFLRGEWRVPAMGLNFKSEKTFDLGPFRITPYLIDHSAYDAYSILIEADGKRLFYSGDFRMHGRKAKLTQKLMASPPEKIDVLLLEGSTLGRVGYEESFPDEAEIEDTLAAVFEDATGLTLVHTSAQNIDRVVSIFRACKKTGKTLVIDLYTAVVLEATGNKNIPQSDWPEMALYVPEKQRIQIKQNQWFALLKKHLKNRIYIGNLQSIANKSVLLFRPLHMQDLENGGLLDDALYIFSQWEGYWEQDSNSYLRDWLNKYTVPKVSIHTSGHASPSDLKRFAVALAPERIVPIHTFRPEKYHDLFDSVEMHHDSEFWKV